MRIPDYQHNWDENIHDCLGIKEEFSNTSQDIKFWPREEPQSIGETQDQGRYGCCWAYTVAGVIRFALYKLGKDGKKFCGVSLYELLVRVLPLFPRSLPSWGNFTFQAWSVIMVFGLYSSSPEKSFDPLWDYPNDGDLKFYPGVVKNENSIRPTPSTLDPDNTNFRAKAIDALEKGPISGSFHACANKFRQNWHQKSGAVYSERVGRRATQRRLYTRDEIIIHSVLIVGYGIRNGEQYFIIQNSWGTTWGFGGFARISMDCFIRFQSIEDYKIKPLTSSDEWLKEWFMTCAEKHGLSHSTWCPSSLLWDCVEVGDGVEEATMPNTLQIMNLIPKESDGEKFEDAVARVRRCVGGGTATEAADSDSDLEVVADCIPVNLRCPMSGSRMKVAGRFKPCVHMGCFDLEVFVEMNMRSRKWHCPVCLKNCCLDNIIIDPYFNRITAKLRSLSVVLMGKNTMIKRSIRVHAEKSGNDTILNLIPLLVGNVGLIFTKGDLKEVSEEVAKYKVGAPARVGLVAPDDVVVPPGNTGLDPSQTSFFQVLNIPTKINKGTVEIITPVELIRKGDKVGSSEAALLAKLGIRPFSYGLEVAKVYDNGSVFSPEVLDLTDEDLMGKFALGVSMATSLALAVSYPTLIAAPHMFINACKNLLAIAVETEYSFPQADKVKEFLEDPSKFAVAAAPAASGGAAPAAAAAKEPEKEEPAEESDDDMGFGLFD